MPSSPISTSKYMWDKLLYISVIAVASQMEIQHEKLCIFLVWHIKLGQRLVL